MRNANLAQASVIFAVQFFVPHFHLGDVSVRPAFHVVFTPASIMLVAIAADALIDAVVLLFDPAVEARGGRALRRARVGDGLSRRSQVIFVQKSCGSGTGAGSVPV